MKRIDLRSKIIPTTIKNTNGLSEIESKIFSTNDLIYIDSIDSDEKQYEEQNKEIERETFATDYALMNNAYAFNTMTGNRKSTTYIWFRTSYDRNKIYCINGLRKLY